MIINKSLYKEKWGNPNAGDFWDFLSFLNFFAFDQSLSHFNTSQNRMSVKVLDHGVYPFLRPAFESATYESY